MPARVTPGFDLLEVTADVGVAARGPTVESVFEQAARGMYAVMADLDQIREAEARTVRVPAAVPERLLERWLLELLFLTEDEGLLFSRFEVTFDRDGALHGVAHGEAIDVDRHTLGPEVKAVTRHTLAVRAVEGGFEARVIFDI